MSSKGEPCLLGTNVVRPLGLMVPVHRVPVRGGLGIRKCAPSVTRVCLVRSLPCTILRTAQLREQISNAAPVPFEPGAAWNQYVCEDLPENDDKTKLVVQNPLGKPIKLAGSVWI